jgi:biopolymer transport protein ExbD
VNVTLPQSSTGDDRDPAGTVTISVTSDGTIAWDKDMISLDDFIARLTAYKAREPNPQILLNADQESFFQQARYVLDEIRKAGIQKVKIETRVRPAGE